MRAAAVVLAAGQGKRMRSRLPKVLHPLCGRPMLLYVLEALRPVVQGPLVVVVGGDAEPVRAALPEGVSVAVQARPLGTGHAVACGLPQLEGFEPTGTPPWSGRRPSSVCWCTTGKGATRPLW